MARTLILASILVGCGSAEGPVFGSGGSGDWPEAGACPAASFQVGQVARSPFMGEPWVHLRWGLPQIFGPSVDLVATGELEALSGDPGEALTGFVRFDATGEVAAFGSTSESRAPWSYEVTREDGRVVRVDYAEDGVVVLELASMTWEDDVLTEILGQEDSTGRDLYTYSWEDGRVVTETLTQAWNGESYDYARIDWSDDGRSAVVTDGAGSQESTVSYDENGRTLGWITVRDDGRTFETSLTYDTSGRLVEQLTLTGEGELESLQERVWADHGGLLSERATSPHGDSEVLYIYDEDGNLAGAARAPDARYPEGWAKEWVVSCP